ncbi:tripartite tricarboxylate transporter substrate binding protein [Noviherbaspirillum sp. CPCC 100848]|uniref:Tripartite tricarboxylate transporter substrate binding protein n=1 Tax=Noviherbaspirillum album TaxID=3080276 RepID=A0ABU6JAR6_9BURK|nr:tripartite tricarboxylate transporter substrate binding protein [Noviherbaspirillum sp. CPCC 100848]MEC4720357.1 tripartite tricarboxylate transporter substrate binding protein [Noviherbaspirillum sp. CPCC 100848]
MWKTMFKSAGCVAVLMLASTQQAVAQEAAYPTKPVRIIVSFPPGGTTDSITRIIAGKLSTKWGQPVIVENRPGAGGNIAAQTVVNASPDGYTLLSSAPGPLTINFNIFKNLNFDARRLVPVAMVADMPNVLTVGPTIKVRTLEELLTQLKQNPGKVTYATQGNATTSHLTAELFQSMTGTKMLHVPYKGSTPALTDLIGGQVDLIFDNITTSLPFYNQKRVNILAVASKERLATLPNVPTAAEAGLKNFESATWVAFVAPPGTPAAVVDKINKGVNESLKEPDVQRQFADLGAQTTGGTPAQMAAFLKSETAKWQKVIETAKITGE